MGASDDVIAEGAPEPQIVEVEGVSCVMQELKTRQFLALLKVFTVGLGGTLPDVVAAIETDDREVFAEQMMGILLVAIPEAEDEFIALVRKMVAPVDDGGDPLRGVELVEFEMRMKNPDIDTVVEVVGGVLSTNFEAVVGLLGKVRVQATRLQRFGTRGQSKTPVSG